MKLCAITGGAGALGSGVARHLVASGYRVAILDREQARVDALCAALGDSAMGATGDFAEPAAWSRALEAMRSTFGAAPSHAALVAGGWQGGAPLHQGSGALYRDMMHANSDTTYGALRALLPAMVEAGHGSIVVIGSRASERPWSSAGAASYAASKAAAVTLAQAVAAEVLERGVRINAVLPSTIDTPANRAAMPTLDPSPWVSVDAIAEVVAFLLSDASRAITGAALPVYGRA